MNRRIRNFSIASALSLAAAGIASATPYDKCGTFIPGFTPNCILFHPDDGTQNVWGGPLPSGFHVGDHVRLQGDFILCPSPCMAACVIDAVWATCPGACAADFDNNGTLNSDDIFAFLAAWFAGNLTADFDGSGGLAVADIFAYIEAWFAGCP